MKTENELIAEFMGAERREGPRAFNPDQTLVQWIIKGNPYNQHRDDIKHWYQPVELKYHESWDWLMPVVEKIDSLGYHVTIMRTRTIITTSLNVQNHIQSIHPGYSMIEVSYCAVVEFIRWYNSQNS